MPIQEAHIYSTGIISLAATVGAALGPTLSIAPDADFDVYMITAQALQADVIVSNWGGTIQILDNSSAGKGWFSVAIPFMAIAGDGRQPYPLPIPKRLKAGTNLTIQVTNNVATATDLYLNLHGYKVQ